MSILWANLKRLNPWLLLPGLAMMFGYVGCEASCTWQILRRLGHRVCWRRCLGYSFVGFYVSSITPSATGGQPAQIYYMNRDGVPVAHGALAFLLVSFVAATAVHLRTRREGRSKALREMTLDSRGKSRVRAVEKYLSVR